MVTLLHEDGLWDNFKLKASYLLDVTEVLPKLSWALVTDTWG